MTVHGVTVLRGAAAPPAGLHIRLWDCGVTWRDVHVAPNVFDWSRLDGFMDEYRGRNVLLVLGMTPAWAARDPEAPGAAWIGPGSSSPPADMAAWEAYVHAVAVRYRGRIAAYQMWNEPQLREFWQPDSYIVLAEMTRRAAAIVHAVSPGTRVVAAPVLPRPSSGGMRRGGRYLSALKAKGWPVDVWAAHLYPEAGTGVARWRDLAQAWRRALSALGAPKKPAWVTETNFNLLAGPVPVTQVPGLVAGVDMACGDLRIHKAYWYAWEHTDPRLLGVPFTPESAGTAALERLMGG